MSTIKWKIIPILLITAYLLLGCIGCSSYSSEEKDATDVTGDTENKPMVIGGGTYAKSLKNIIAFGPEKPGIDYRIHSADEFILVSGMEEAVLVYMEAIKNLLAI